MAQPHGRETAVTLGTLLLLDLDDTVMLSRRKLNPAEHTVSAVDAAGEALCHSTAQHLALLERFRDALVVPVTGRSEAAMGRVRLPFSSYRVLDHGATVLYPDGSRDKVWDARVGAGEDLTELTAELEARFSPMAGYRVLPLETRAGPYGLCIKHAERGPEATAQAAVALRERASTLGWSFLNAPGAPSLVRPGVGKREACVYLLEHLCPDRTRWVVFGAGDALSDVPFLSLCDFVVMPGQSALMQALGGVE
ncbi:Hydroxymethylpyrimidine pyrophosphatase [Deinococcus hopiensis KR-140]|uniref:Hydroxymethylpyrimidine pyrophosphatase n=1 Tax=Deinococcus hopiensis KR-140 TaxID=695939 RepID=A0A1W1V568_9DEIO|nr:Hydroxymethylpyrimidine pyrophosphatase [Deinococcus hopiensis KR-140]